MGSWRERGGSLGGFVFLMKVYELLSKVVTQTTWVNYYRELDGVHSLRLSGDLSTAWPSNTKTH